MHQTGEGVWTNHRGPRCFAGRAGLVGNGRDAGGAARGGTGVARVARGPALVVASQVYDWTGMLKDILAKRKTGVLGGVAYTLTLENGGLKVAYNPAYKLGAAAKKAGDDAIAGVKKGAIKVNP